MSSESVDSVAARRSSIREDLETVYRLQKIDSSLDAIYRLRGELPLEIEDLSDEIEGLNTRAAKLRETIAQNQERISQMRIGIKNAESLRERYQEQQQHVRNNREFDAIASEIEYQGLEIEHLTKQIKETRRENDDLSERGVVLDEQIGERMSALDAKQKELKEIESETVQREQELKAARVEQEGQLAPRLAKGYNRIRNNSRNGLAVVGVVRGACGGCFNRVPPQQQLEIRMGEKLIVCEYCGRLLVDTQSLEPADGQGEESSSGEEA